MSLAYPGPSSEIVNVVGREAFLEALGDPGLRIRVLDKGPTNMEEALRIALNLEALDKSKEVESAAISAAVAFSVDGSATLAGGTLSTAGG